MPATDDVGEPDACLDTTRRTQRLRQAPDLISVQRFQKRAASRTCRGRPGGPELPPTDSSLRRAAKGTETEPDSAHSVPFTARVDLRVSNRRSEGAVDHNCLPGLGTLLAAGVDDPRFSIRLSSCLESLTGRVGRVGRRSMMIRP